MPPRPHAPWLPQIASPRPLAASSRRPLVPPSPPAHRLPSPLEPVLQSPSSPPASRHLRCLPLVPCLPLPKAAGFFGSASAGGRGGRAPRRLSSARPPVGRPPRCPARRPRALFHPRAAHAASSTSESLAPTRALPQWPRPLIAPTRPHVAARPASSRRSRSPTRRRGAHAQGRVALPSAARYCAGGPPTPPQRADAARVALRGPPITPSAVHSSRALPREASRRALGVGRWTTPSACRCVRFVDAAASAARRRRRADRAFGRASPGEPAPRSHPPGRPSSTQPLAPLGQSFRLECILVAARRAADEPTLRDAIASFAAGRRRRHDSLGRTQRLAAAVVCAGRPEALRGAARLPARRPPGWCRHRCRGRPTSRLPRRVAPSGRLPAWRQRT